MDNWNKWFFHLNMTFDRLHKIRELFRFFLSSFLPSDSSFVHVSLFVCAFYSLLFGHLSIRSNFRMEMIEQQLQYAIHELLFMHSVGVSRVSFVHIIMIIANYIHRALSLSSVLHLLTKWRRWNLLLVHIFILIFIWHIQWENCVVWVTKQWYLHNIHYLRVNSVVRAMRFVCVCVCVCACVLSDFRRYY